MDSIRFSDGFYRFSYGFHIDIGFPMDSVSFHMGFPMDSIGFFHGFYRFSYGFPMDSIGFHMDSISFLLVFIWIL